MWITEDNSIELHGSNGLAGGVTGSMGRSDGIAHDGYPVSGYSRRGCNALN